MPAHDPKVRSLSCRIAAVSKNGGPDDARLPELRASLREAVAEATIRQLVAPLSEASRIQCAVMVLRGVKTIAERVAELRAQDPPMTEDERREVVRILGPALRAALRPATHRPQARRAATA